MTASSHCIILWEIKQSRNLWSLSQNRCEPNFINVHVLMPLDFFFAPKIKFIPLFLSSYSLLQHCHFDFRPRSYDTEIIDVHHSSVAVRRYVCGWRDDNKDACVNTKNTASGKSANFWCLLQRTLTIVSSRTLIHSHPSLNSS